MEDFEEGLRGCCGRALWEGRSGMVWMRLIRHCIGAERYLGVLYARCTSANSGTWAPCSAQVTGHNYRLVTRSNVLNCTL